MYLPTTGLSRTVFIFYFLSLSLLWSQQTYGESPSWRVYTSTKTVEAVIKHRTARIKKNPKDAVSYFERGNAYFYLRDFDSSIWDFSQVIKLNRKLDIAYFGRGMARARNGEIDAGIADLSIYIKRHPNSSLAYTKRGVRYIWKGDRASAERDFKKAVALDPHNAEAHDDLGVLYAQKRQYKKAIEHFTFCIKNEPSYQKAYHNLAMVYYLVNENKRALIAVNQGLKLHSNNRNSLLLKSTILTALGRHAEAKKFKEDAEFEPEGSWSERTDIQ